MIYKRIVGQIRSDRGPDPWGRGRGKPHLLFPVSLLPSHCSRGGRVLPPVPSAFLTVGSAVGVGSRLYIFSSLSETPSVSPTSPRGATPASPDPYVRSHTRPYSGVSGSSRTSVRTLSVRGKGVPSVAPSLSGGPVHHLEPPLLHPSGPVRPWVRPTAQGRGGGRRTLVSVGGPGQPPVPWDEGPDGTILPRPLQNGRRGTLRALERSA